MGNYCCSDGSVDKKSEMREPGHIFWQNKYTKEQIEQSAIDVQRTFRGYMARKEAASLRSARYGNQGANNYDGMTDYENVNV
jgi:hypothetical protein